MIQYEGPLRPSFRFLMPSNKLYISIPWKSIEHSSFLLVYSNTNKRGEILIVANFFGRGFFFVASGFFLYGFFMWGWVWSRDDCERERGIAWDLGEVCTVLVVDYEGC